jgi:hypothetical protein
VLIAKPLRNLMLIEEDLADNVFMSNFFAPNNEVMQSLR